MSNRESLANEIFVLAAESYDVAAKALINFLILAPEYGPARYKTREAAQQLTFEFAAKANAFKNRAKKIR